MNESDEIALAWLVIIPGLFFAGWLFLKAVPWIFALLVELIHG